MSISKRLLGFERPSAGDRYPLQALANSQDQHSLQQDYLQSEEAKAFNERMRKYWAKEEGKPRTSRPTIWERFKQ
jgi:hypothetical protein